MISDDIQAERLRRMAIWGELEVRSTTDQVDPHLVRELRIHRGQMGVFRDQEVTGQLTPFGTGVAVGLLHTGSAYADDLYDDCVIYHYPVTSRGIRDRNEIEAMKACADYSLPVFVVITPFPGARTRSIRLGWVIDHDDSSGQLLISFSSEPPKHAPASEGDESEPFTLKIDRNSGITTTRVRYGQGKFRFTVFKRYGSICTFCKITESKLLEAAHLCPVEEDGCDDPRNGLVMCLTHHKAFGEGYLRINPNTGKVLAAQSIRNLEAIGVTVTSIRHLKRPPHRESLEWVWARS